PGPRALYYVRQPGDPRLRAIAAHADQHHPGGARPVGVRHPGAGGAVLAGAALDLAAHSAAAVSRAVDLARRRHGGVPRRGPGVADHVSADLSARRARRLAGRDRAAVAAPD